MLAWAAVADHDGLRRWRDPAAWVVSEIMRGNRPPGEMTLDAWQRTLPPATVDWSRYQPKSAVDASDYDLPCVDADAALQTASDAAEEAPEETPTDALDLCDLLDATLPARLGAAVAQLVIQLTSTGALVAPRTVDEQVLAWEIRGVLADCLRDCDLPAAVCIAAPSEMFLPPGDGTTIVPTAASLPRIRREPLRTLDACDDAAPPHGVSAAIWQTLSASARAAVRVRNWQMLRRCADDSVVRQLVPPSALAALDAPVPRSLVRSATRQRTMVPAVVWREHVSSAGAVRDSG